MRVLIVDDEPPAHDELGCLLTRDGRVTSVHRVSTPTQALRLLGNHPIDVVFCDVKAPRFDGFEFARVLAQFAEPPHLVLVTTAGDRATTTFRAAAADCVMRPVSPARLAEVLSHATVSSGSAKPAPHDERIAVAFAGVTRFLWRSEIRYVTAEGDYVRLHTLGGSHLLRRRMKTLVDEWAPSGFVRIHRSTLVSLAHVDELHISKERCFVRLGDKKLAVSKRSAYLLREILHTMRRATSITSLVAAIGSLTSGLIAHRAANSS